MKSFKSNKGITIIALIITVIVLIILASIAVQQIVSENGIIRKAFEARNADEEDKNRENRMLDELREEARGEGSKGITVLPDYDVLATKIYLNKDLLIFSKNGGTEQLIETILPENATNKSVTWACTGVKELSVNNGLVKYGPVITITPPGQTSKAETNIRLSSRSQSLEKTVETSVGRTIIGPNIGAIGGGLGPLISSIGTVTVTMNDGSGASASCLVVLMNSMKLVVEGKIPREEDLISVTYLTLNKNNMTLLVTESETLIATITPTTATLKELVWSSSNPSIAKVDENGEVTGISMGETVITCSTADGSNLKATCNVTVKPTTATPITPAIPEDPEDEPIFTGLKPGEYVNYGGLKNEDVVIPDSLIGPAAVPGQAKFNAANYKGKWQVLYNDSTHGLQIISCESIGNLTISQETGYNTGTIEALNLIAKNFINQTLAYNSTSSRSVGRFTNADYNFKGIMSTFAKNENWQPNHMKLEDAPGGMYGEDYEQLCTIGRS